MNVQDLTIEQQRELYRRQIRGFQIAEAMQRRNWKPPTIEEKLAFDRLMQDTLHHRKSIRDCGMTKWYAALMRGQHE